MEQPNQNLNEPVLLNLACGNKPMLKPWINVDMVKHPAMVEAELEFKDKLIFVEADITKYSDQENFVDHILASHVIEHIPSYDVPSVLRTWKTWLKPGGSLALEFPDILKCCQNVIRGYIENNNFLYNKMGIRSIFGDRPTAESNPLMQHLWGYSVRDMLNLAQGVGFEGYSLETPTQKPWAADIRDTRIVLFKGGCEEDERFEYYEYYNWKRDGKDEEESQPN